MFFLKFSKREVMSKELYTIKETANMLGLTRAEFYKWLRAEKIMLKTSDTNVPSDKYIRLGWFNVTYGKINNNGYKALVPIVRFTTKGFEGVERMLKKIKPDNAKIIEFITEVEEALKKQLSFLGLGTNERNNRVLRVGSAYEYTFYVDYGTENQQKLLTYKLFPKREIWINNTLQVSIF